MGNKETKKAIIIGAGPAGLTAAFELLEQTDIVPIIFEASPDFGGISKTAEYKGNRMDIGGHRFFSKSQRVTDWWLNVLPMQGEPSVDDKLLDKKIPLAQNSIDPEKTDEVMLYRGRLSRILFLRKFFDYPVTLSLNTILNLGFFRMLKIGFSYIKAAIFKKDEKSLEDFFINRFGKELYATFFKDYTQKVWGIPCSEIEPEWGAQRIKGLSITKTILHALKQILPQKSNEKNVETSLIEQFMYPKLGPGYMWEAVAKKIQEKGGGANVISPNAEETKTNAKGGININEKVVKINSDEGKITSIIAKNTLTDDETEHFADYFISTMPVKDLIETMGDAIPSNVQNVAKNLQYRDFITVGLLLKELKIKNTSKIKTLNNLVPDNWIYIQEKDVKLGRLQVFNNWSPYLVKDLKNVWLGLEYFCNEGDELWNLENKDFANFAIEELAKIGVIEPDKVLDSVVIRIQKAYPAYFGAYKDFDIIKKHINNYENLFLIGRNGMHRYNNMDHSMLTAMMAVDNILNGVKTKDNIWGVNVEETYHESK